MGSLFGHHQYPRVHWAANRMSDTMAWRKLVPQASELPDNKILVDAYGATELPDQKENRKTNGEKTYPHGLELEDRQTEDVRTSKQQPPPLRTYKCVFSHCSKTPHSDTLLAA
ncbi:hypothetical protein IRJ41_002440 [Triplophysa rosa]|uniref:Uncharacterized protein n=1 Tax=Triplophysa rosa TaxID=992332 RepID=A0A9W7W9U5_TRIRA|nr:hypothetical protein IRJ41_002440 [Triplophysa rosa]